MIHKYRLGRIRQVAIRIPHHNPKFTIRCLTRLATCDRRTTTGRRLGYLGKQCNVDRGTWEKLSPQNIMSNFIYVSSPAGNEWISILGSNPLQVGNVNLALPGFSSYEVDEIFTMFAPNDLTNNRVVLYHCERNKSN